MAMSLRMNRKQKRRGFTLTEIAIVLGIIGLILGAIWAAAAAVYSNMKVNNAERGITYAAQQVHGMFATASGNTGQNADTDITAPGMFPQDWTYTVGKNVKYGNPWNTNITTNVSYSYVIGNSTYIGIELDNIDDNGCSALIAYFQSSASSANGGQITGLVGNGLLAKAGNGKAPKIGALPGDGVYAANGAGCTGGPNSDDVIIQFNLSKM